MKNQIEVITFEKSSAIENIVYNHTTELLEIKFNTGGTYEYKGVPSSLVEAMKLAPSVGRFYHENIRDKFE